MKKENLLSNQNTTIQLYNHFFKRKFFILHACDKIMIMKYILLTLLGITKATSSDKTIKLNFPYPLSKRSLKPYSIEANNELSFQTAQEKCETNVHCAGVSEEYYEDEDEEEDGYTHHIIFHSYVPPEGIIPKLEDEAMEVNTTISYYHSRKPFVVHRGMAVGGIIQMYTDITVDEAQELCNNISNCVGFTYPLHSNTMNMIHPDGITFLSSVDSFPYYQNQNNAYYNMWYTLLSNDISKAGYINATDFEFDVDLTLKPYSTCCNSHDIPENLDDIRKYDTLPRISCNISKEEFTKQYIIPRKPVMLVGCDESWEALQKWNFHHLSSRFENDTLWRASVGDNALDEAMEWGNIVNAIEDNSKFVIFDQLDRSHGKILEEDYRIPQPLQGADLYNGLLRFPDEEYGPLRWFCVSNGNSGTEAHMDPVSTDAWNSIVQGHKWWVIFPDTVDKNRHMSCDTACSYYKNTKYPPIRYWYSSIGMHVNKFIYPGTNQRPIQVLQSPGETIYVPYGRIHSVYNVDETIAVTANFGSIGNFNRVWIDIITSGKKHWSRAYYNLFDKKLREMARLSGFWPPEEYEDYDMDEADEEDIDALFDFGDNEDDDSRDDDDDSSDNDDSSDGDDDNEDQEDNDIDAANDDVDSDKEIENDDDNKDELSIDENDNLEYDNDKTNEIIDNSKEVENEDELYSNNNDENMEIDSDDDDE